MMVLQQHSIEYQIVKAETRLNRPPYNSVGLCTLHGGGSPDPTPILPIAIPADNRALTPDQLFSYGSAFAFRSSDGGATIELKAVNR